MPASSPRVRSTLAEAQSRPESAPEAIGSGATPNTVALAVVRLTDDIHSVAVGRQTLGYIHRVGTVYVALLGDSLDRAVEVGQSMAFDQAVDMVRASAS